MNVAIIVAAGKGVRMGREEGKQLLPLAGMPALAHTLIAFEDSAAIEAIIVVTTPENMQAVREISEEHFISKLVGLVPGGAERQDSVYNGLLAIEQMDDYDFVELVAVHDGARPLVTPELIDEAVEAVGGFDGAVVGIPAKDTIKLVSEGFVVETPDREQTWQIQTPQVFKLEVLREAHRSAKEAGFYGTDESVLVERAGGKVKVALGSDENIKITTPSDLVVAEAILKARKERG